LPASATAAQFSRSILTMVVPLETAFAVFGHAGKGGVRARVGRGLSRSTSIFRGGTCSSKMPFTFGGAADQTPSETPGPVYDRSESSQTRARAQTTGTMDILPDFGC